MKKKDFFRIINEEISQFDFLGNDKFLKEQEEVKLLHDEQFQKQFIIDSITRMRDVIKVGASDAHVSNNPELKDDGYHNDMSVDVVIDITYQHKQNPVNFDIAFLGDRIGYYTDHYSEDRTHDHPGAFDAWYESIEWSEIDVNMYTKEGDDVAFDAFEKAPSKIQELFIRSYVESIIENKTDFDEVREEMPQYTAF